MTGIGTPLLSAWQSFYVMVGSAAAAVIAIQFVVITLIANLRRPAPADTISAFATPTVVQLGSASAWGPAPVPRSLLLEQEPSPC